MGRGDPRRRFFNISFSIRSLAFSCRSCVSSASSSLTGCPADPLAGGWPLRARNTQFANVFADISSDRATAGMLRPLSVTCFTAAARNSGV
jgi:hypothetical protein